MITCRLRSRLDRAWSAALVGAWAAIATVAVVHAGDSPTPSQARQAPHLTASSCHQVSTLPAVYQAPPAAL